MTSWRTIEGYNGFYKISEFGEVVSYHKQGVSTDFADEPHRMAPCSGRDGRLQVALRPGGKLGKAKMRTVHSLVAETFIGPRPNGLIVCHNDGDHLNNHFTNLRYDTHQSNTADRSIHGTMLRGELNPYNKMKEHDVIHIKMLMKQGTVGARVAAFYGTDRGQVCSIKSGRAWGYVPTPIGLICPTCDEKVIAVPEMFNPSWQVGRQGQVSRDSQLL